MKDGPPMLCLQSSFQVGYLHQELDSVYLGSKWLSIGVPGSMEPDYLFEHRFEKICQPQLGQTDWKEGYSSLDFDQKTEGFKLGYCYWMKNFAWRIVVSSKMKKSKFFY
jgi:hypothetical protein